MYDPPIDIVPGGSGIAEHANAVHSRVQRRKSLLEYGARPEYSAAVNQPFVAAALLDTNIDVLLVPGWFQVTGDLVYSITRQLIVEGTGRHSSGFIFATDLGTGHYALKPSDPNTDANEHCLYLKHLGFSGPFPQPSFSTWSAALTGTSPVGMDGIMGAARVHLEDVQSFGFHAGFLPRWDHWTHLNCDFFGNFVGRYWDHAGNYGQDAVLIQAHTAGNLFAGDMVSGQGHADHNIGLGCHNGFSPYAWYKQAVTTGSRSSEFIVGWEFRKCSFEQCGNGIVFDENAGTSNSSLVSGNEMTSVFASIDTSGFYRIVGTSAPAAGWTVKVLKDNVFALTVGNGGPFDKGTSYWISGEWIDGNEFYGGLLDAAVMGAYGASTIFLRWANVSLPFTNNSWRHGNNRGKFLFLNLLYGAITKNRFVLQGGNGSSGVEAVVADPGNRAIAGSIHYLTGPCGVARTSVANAFDVCMVQTEGICDVTSSTGVAPVAGDYWAVQDGANPGKVKGLQADTAEWEGVVIGYVSGSSGAGLPLWTIRLDLAAKNSRWPKFVVNSGNGAPPAFTPIEMPYVDKTNHRLYVWDAGASAWKYAALT